MTEFLATGGRNKRLLGVLNGVLVHSVLSKNSGPGLLGVISGLGVLTEGVISEFYCMFQISFFVLRSFAALLDAAPAQERHFRDERKQQRQLLPPPGQVRGR